MKLSQKYPILLLLLFLLPWVPYAHAHTLHVVGDSYNRSNQVNRIDGSRAEVNVRDTMGSTRQGFAQFDLSTLPVGITSADVDKASLRLYVRNVSSPGNVDLHLVTSAWDEETLSFNNSPTFNATPFAADVALASSDEEDFIILDITNELKSWIDTPANNFGIALIPDNVNVQFSSKEDRGPTNPMELEVALIGPKGDKGDTGDQGLPGNDGTNGTNGTNGTDGQDGTNGTNGTNGTDGVDGESGKDDADGVEITFTREFQYDPGTGAVDAIDINGTALKINPTEPTVTLGGQARTVLASGDIPNTTPQLQQVVIDMPASLLAGSYKLKLSNTQGDSEVFIPLNEIALHDGSTWTQATASAPWGTRYAMGVLNYDDKLWVITGSTGATGSYHNDVWSSPDGTSWTQVNSNLNFSGRRIIDGATVHNGKMYIGSGLGGGAGASGTYYADMYASTDGVTWETKTTSPPWSGRHGAALVSYDGKLWIMGGCGYYCSLSTMNNEVWYSEDDGVTWTQTTVTGSRWSPSMPNVVVFDNKMWVVGSNYGSDVWYSTDGSTWTQATADGGFAKTATAIVYDGKMWAIGGGPAVHNEVWSSTDGITWTQATANASWSDRLESGVVEFKNKIFVLGGYTSSSQNDVWHTSD